MNQKNDNPNDQPTEKQQPSDETQAEYREISEEELKQILEDNIRWTESELRKFSDEKLQKILQDHRRWIESLSGEIRYREISDEELKQIFEDHIKWTESELKKFSGNELQKILEDNKRWIEALGEEPEYREISEEELKQILEVHKKWLESDGKEGEKADFSKTNLQEVDLRGANLQQADLSGANLKKADLIDTNLREAELFRVNLHKADLLRANLQKAYLSQANLQKADLIGAKLQDANLKEANLQKANLGSANLQKAYLREVNLQKANLKEANLRKAELHGANLQKANLGSANLQKANLREVNLQKANLFGADLQNADLLEANLQNAKLYYVNLQSSNLTRADMQYTVLDGVTGLSTAKLQYANFEGAIGLLGNEFAQTDVTGTKLPDDIKEFKALEIVEKTSENARKIFFAMLLGCVYSWLTIATTTDVRLLTNTASSPLPIIGTEIPIAWFYIAAPLVIICLYLYFHLYLDNLWEGLSSLPAIFPDGKRLDQRAYPWLLNTLVRKHFKRLKKRLFIARMKEWITIFLAWWVVPITLIAFWLRYIPRHVWWGTRFHIALIIVSIAFAIIFYRSCSFTLKGKDKIPINIKRFWSDKGFYYFILKIFPFSAFILLIGLLFSLISVSTLNGFRAEKHYKPVFEDFIFDFHHSLKNFVPWAFDKLGYDVFADFREKSVSERPERYWEIPEDDLPKYVKGANLKERNFYNADMYKAFLVKADLRGASLNDANLREANLQQANIEGANLMQANLEGAILQQAFLDGANLQQANLGAANLQQAVLMQANLQQAVLVGGNLQKAVLVGANLQQAVLVAADLQEAILIVANLQQTNLEGADLTGAKNLTIEQLSQVKTLYKAKLDPELLEQVKKCCPHLLEKPKGEPDKSN